MKSLQKCQKLKKKNDQLILTSNKIFSQWSNNSGTIIKKIP